MDNDQNGFPRHSLYKKPEKKVCQFFKDGDQHFPGIKLVINPRRYQNFENLQNDLSERVSGLPFGVRSIYTPRGRDPIARLDQLEDNGKYVCSTFPSKAKGVNVEHINEVRQWRTAGKPQSGKRAYSKYLQETMPDAPPRKAWSSSMSQSPSFVASSPRQPKKITVVKDDEPEKKHVILLNRRTMQSFEDVLGDIRGVFQSPITHMFTLGGKPVKSLSSIIHGPGTYLVSQYEHCMPATAKSDPGSSNSSRHMFTGPHHTISELRKRRTKLSHTRGKWRLEIVTSDLPSAGTTATVSVTVYGQFGNSMALPLGKSDGVLFSNGRTDTFKIAVGNIGEVYKIRIAHDNSGEFPGWMVDQVTMLDVHTQEQLVFPCHKWLSRDEDDGEICRELPATRQREPVLPVVKYEVLITTGDLWNAGTDANVYLTMYGERGDTGVRQMYWAERPENFQKGQTDVFSVEAVSLGTVQRVVIGHDDITPGNGWHLKKVVVRDPTRHGQEWEFMCNSWLDGGVGNKKIVQELRVLDNYSRSQIEKQLWKNEQWKFLHDNQVLLFSKNTGKALEIQKDGKVDGTADDHDAEAVFNVVDRKANFRVFQSALKKKFHLSLVNGKVHGKGNGGVFCEFKIRVLDDHSVNLESAKFHNQMVSVQESGRLGDPRPHDNDLAREFFVYCKGMFRHDGIIMFYTSATQVLITDLHGSLHATGHPGSLAKFKVHKVRNGCVRMFENIAKPNNYLCYKDGTFDCKGDGDTFCHFRVTKLKDLGYVTLESITSQGTYLSMLPDGEITGSTDAYDRNAKLYPTVIEFGTASKMATSPNVLAMESRTTPLRTDTRNMSAESTFGAGDWKIWIATEEEASQADEIVLWVYGDQANSGPIILWTGEDNGQFLAGNDDEFKVSLGGVGEIYKIRLELQSQNPYDKPSWKVKRVKLKDMTTRETLKFDFNCWLSLKHADATVMRELPAVRPAQDVLPVVKYQVLVDTGKVTGADTDANVYVNLYGERGDTGKRVLVNSNNPVNFQEGQMDVFEVEAVSLGRITHCIVGHDGDGIGEGWYLNEILVREGPDATHEYVFPCCRWLDTGMDDKQISRSLGPIDFRPIPGDMEDPEVELEAEEGEKVQAGDWKVWVTTEEGVCEADEIVLWVYGEEANTGPLILWSGEQNGKFQAGSTDDFKVSLGGVGKIYKIRLELLSQNANNKPSWKVKTVKLKDMTFRETLKFDINSWLSLKHTGAAVMKERPAIRPAQDVLPVVKYQVLVHTGELTGADTDTNVYVTLYGERGDSGKRRLVYSNNPVNFREGQVDVFEVEAVSLGRVTHCIVGHDGDGIGEGWYLNEILVRHGPDATHEYVFPCCRWLDTGMDDGQITRSLEPIEFRLIPEDVEEPEMEEEGEKIQAGDWKVWVTTEEGVSEADEIILWVYGEEANTGPLILWSGEQNGKFQAGSTDDFKVSLGGLGKIYKIRLELLSQNANNKPSWKVKTVKLKDMTTRETLKFDFNCWLSLKHTDPTVMRELPAVRPAQDVLPVVKYQVLVHTGELTGADTDANVYVTLYGERGDSGKRRLVYSNNPVNFREGQVDVFEVEAVSLGRVTHCIVGHDGDGIGEGWYLNEILVREGPDATHEYVFPCCRWLDTGMDDGHITRSLEPIAFQPISGTGHLFEVYVTSGPELEPLAATFVDHVPKDTVIVIYGDMGKSEQLPLVAEEDNTSSPGNTQYFKVYVTQEIGQVFKIRLGLAEQPDVAQYWTLDSVRVRDADNDRLYSFELTEQLFSGSQVEAWKEMPVKTLAQGGDEAERKPVDPLKVHNYQVEVYTRDEPNAATDANVSITVEGLRGDTGKRRLLVSQNGSKFQPGQMDVFTIEAVDMISLIKVIVEYEGEGQGKGWFLDKVVIKDLTHADKEFVFNCARWVNVGDNDTKVELALGDDPLPPESEGHLFEVYVTSGSELEPLAATFVDHVPKDTVIVIYGDMGKSEQLPLVAEEDDNPSPGNTQYFKVNVKEEIGEVFKIRVGLTEQPDVAQYWTLDSVRVRDADNDRLYSFELTEQLFSGSQVEAWKEMPVKTLAQGGDEAERKPVDPLKVHNYQVEVYTRDEPNAATDANVSITVEGLRGDTGKRKLLVSQNGSKFQPGQMDVFTIQAVDMVNLTKVVVGYEGEGQGKGWFLDKVIVKDSANADYQYVFTCGRWVNVGDTDTSVELPLTEKVPGHLFEVYVTSGPELEPLAATFVDHVPKDTVIVIYGDMGKSEQLPLVAEEDDTSSPGNTQYFKVNVRKEIGEVFKIRVGLAEQPDVAQYWTLDSVRVRDADNDRLYSFELTEQLFSGSQVEAWKEMPVKMLAQGGDEAERKPVDPLKVHNYQVEVYTRDEPNAATDANVSITVEGLRGDTGKRKLLVSQNGSKFQPGQMDVFTIQAVDMVNLTKVVVGYEGEGQGKGWFLDKVIVKDSANADYQYVFTCGRWVNVGDADTSVELPLTEKVPGHLFEVYVTSGPELEPLAATFVDHVPKDTVIVIYGDMGKSEQLPLVAEEDDTSSPGNTQYFKVNVRKEIGEVFKIRVGLAEQPDVAQYWTLDSVRVRDTDNDRLYSFELTEQLFSGSQVEAWKEMPVKTLAQGGDEAERKPVDPLKVHNYQVEVYTRDEPNAATDANVSITIEGLRGDTGKRKLLVSQNGSKFQPGQLDVFTIQAVDMVNLTKVMVGYEGEGQGKGWFLDKVIVKDSANADCQYVFTCGRWVNVGDADTSVELPLTEKVPGHLFEVYVTSGPELEPLAATFVDHVPKDSVIVIYGDMGKSEQLPLVAEEDDTSSPGNTQYFKVNVRKEIGEVFKIRVGLAEQPDVAQYWTLDSVRVRDADNDRLYSFELTEQLFSGSQVEAWKEMPVKTLAQGGDEAERKPVDPLKVHNYQVEVYTRDEPNAATDANVSITVEGLRGDTGKRRLLVSQNGSKFQPGQMDVFTIQAVDMVNLTKVVVGYEGEGQGKGWFLDKVIVKDSANADYQYVFMCGRWVNVGDADTSVELPLTEKVPGHLFEVYVTSGPELEPLAATFVDHVPKDTVIVIYGDMGKSEQLPLVAEEDDTSSPGNTQYFKVNVRKEIGEVFKIRIGLAEQPDVAQYWTLDSVRVRDADNDRLYSFELTEQLFSGSQVEAWKEMPVKTLAQGGDEAERKPVDPLKVHNYHVEVYTRDEPNAATDANVSITVEGLRGDTGKRRLLVSQNEKKFQPGQMDVFTVQAVDMINLTKVTIGHDGQGQGNGWFLDKIVVKESPEADQQFIFNCARWLDEGEDDHLTERELPLTDKSPV